MCATSGYSSKENQKDKTTKVLNSKKSVITIKTGKTETTTNDSLIIINH